MGSFRRPRTQQEKKQNQNCEYCRPARRPHNLIDAWDDDRKHTDKCWKNYRKTQYKVKALPKKKKNSSSFAKSMENKDHWHLNHRCRYWCQGRFSENKCKGCEERELNRKEYEQREFKKLQAQYALEQKERQREWNKECYEYYWHGN